MPAEPMRIGPLLEKYPDMIDPLFLYYGSNKLFHIPEKGYIDFSSQGIWSVAGVKSLTYNEYLDIQISSLNKTRKWLEKCYYNTPVWFYGQIDKVGRNYVCFKNMYVCGIYQEGDVFYGREEYVWMDRYGFEALRNGD